MSGEGGVVHRTVSIIRDLMEGACYDRHAIATIWEVGLAAADRYIREIRRVPGMRTFRTGKRLFVQYAPRRKKKKAP